MSKLMANDIDLEKVSWRKRRPCAHEFAHFLVGSSILLGVEALVYFFVLVLGCSLKDNPFFGITLFFVSYCYIGLIVEVFSVNSSSLIKHFRNCQECKEKTCKALAREAVKMEERRVAAAAKEASTRKTCDSCLLSIIVIEACGAMMLLFANIWPSSGTADTVGMTIFCAQFFIAALYLVYARKNCNSCQRLNHPQSVSTGSNIAVEDAGKENDRSEPMSLSPTVGRESKFAQKARWLLADIHNIMSGSSGADPECLVQSAAECQDPEGCEKAVAEYLSGQDVTYKLLMNGLYAAEISRAVNYPYAMVRAVLEKLGRCAFVRVLNQSLVVRDYNA